MESYPDPTLLSRQPGYPYSLDSVGTPKSLRYQNDNFTPPQFSGPSQDLEATFEDYVVRAEAYEHHPRTFQQPFGTTEHGRGTSGGVAAAHIMTPPALPLSRKSRRVASQDTQSKRQRLPVVGVFRPPQPLVPRARSPERAFRNTQNANFTTKNQERSFRTLAKHKNTRGQIKSIIIYKENRQGKLVLQKYSHQRNDGVVAVREKPAHTHKPPSASQHPDRRAIRSFALPFPPAFLAPNNQDPISHNYLHSLYGAFKRDFIDTSLPRTNNLAETLNPADLDLTMEHQQSNAEEEMVYYFDDPAPHSAPPQIQNNVIHPCLPSQPGQQHVAMAHITRQGEARSLATPSNYNAAVSATASNPNRNGHGVKEFVELINHEGRDNADHNQERSITSPSFSDPPLADLDATEDESGVSAALLGGSAAPNGAVSSSAAAEHGGADDETDTTHSTRSTCPFFSQEQPDNTNPFAFALGEHLTHPQLSSPRWDGNDLTGFPIHLPDHSSEAQQAIWSAYIACSLQPAPRL